MTQPQGTFKLRVNIDGQEFEAEGQADLVNRQFEVFRLMIQEASGSPQEDASHRRREPAGPALTPHKLVGENRTDSDLSKLFRIAPHSGLLSLRQPPPGKYPEADTVLLLLFGHKRFRSEEDVPVTVLTEALKQSGCPVKRLDRILTIYTRDHSVIRSGRGKGGKYRLTNLGLTKAEAIAREITKDSDER